VIDEATERFARAVALPLALLGAWLAVKTAPGLVRMVTMWVHESGHAVTAWMFGYSAWPGPWFTPITSERSPLFIVVFVGALAFGCYTAWQMERWFWVAASLCVVGLMLACTLFVSSDTAQQVIVFGGDGGMLVLGTILMLTVYAREDHPVRENQLRWGLLAIGALAFMDAHTVWSGPMDRLPFGEDENGLSDPSVLTELHGWNPLGMVHRYNQLAYACFAVLAVVYIAGIYAANRPNASSDG
jgi:hypothetical protein